MFNLHEGVPSWHRGSGTMRKCTCGATNEDAAVFCESCGRRLEGGPGETMWLQKFCTHCSKAYPAKATFCDVCGRRLSPLPERKRRLLLSDPRGRVIAVEERKRDFGRGDFASWTRSGEAQRISRAQFRILVVGPEFLIEHVSTANPTVLNGRAITRRRRLRHGDVIDLGQGALRLLVTIL